VRRLARNAADFADVPEARIACAWLVGLLGLTGTGVSISGGDGEAADGAGNATDTAVAFDTMAGMAVFEAGSVANGAAFAAGDGARVCALVALPMIIHTAKNPSATANPAPSNPFQKRGAESGLLPASTTLRNEGLGSVGTGFAWEVRLLLSPSGGNAKSTRVS